MDCLCGFPSPLVSELRQWEPWQEVNGGQKLQISAFMFPALPLMVAGVGSCRAALITQLSLQASIMVLLSCSLGVGESNSSQQLLALGCCTIAYYLPQTFPTLSLKVPLFNSQEFDKTLSLLSSCMLSGSSQDPDPFREGP